MKGKPLAGRNRSQGWQHAKLSGEKWEGSFCIGVASPTSPIAKALAKDLPRLGLCKQVAKAEVVAGNVSTVLGDHQRGKPDVRLTLEDGTSLRVSLKKPSTDGGQAHLQTLKRFMESWPLVMGTPLPPTVQRVLTLFAGAPGPCVLSAWAKVDAHLLSKTELKHLKLRPVTIAAAYPDDWDGFSSWLEAQRHQLLEFCMFTGAAAEKQDQATHLYLGKHDRLLSRYELARALAQTAHPVGIDRATIDLAWGFLQTHNPRGKGAPRLFPNQLQFHWNGTKLLGLLGE